MAPHRVLYECGNCGKEVKRNYASGRFCCLSCARTHNSRMARSKGRPPKAAAKPKAAPKENLIPLGAAIEEAINAAKRRSVSLHISIDNHVQIGG